MGRLFGTDGVRGIANIELTPELAFRLGQAGAIALAEEFHLKPKILIGKDTRVSSDLLEASLAAGICSVGAEVVLLGVVPTPAVAYLTRLHGAHAGAMISASHNPMEYNGIKFFDRGGYKLSDALEDEIEEIINADRILTRPVGADVGKIIHTTDALKSYMDFAKSTIDTDLSGLKIAIDCANGAASLAAPEVLRSLGAEVFVINNQPSGTNINANCGSTYINAIREFTLDTGADFGLSFDGDADRVLAVDETGELVDGDKILAICGNDLKSQGRLKDNVIVATVMSNLGLYIMARNNGIEISQTKVGDRYVLERMAEGGYSLGGEQSGHIIFLEHNTTGDGLVTGLQLCAIVKKSGQKMSQLARIMTPMPQILVSAHVKNEVKSCFNSYSEIMEAIDSIEQEFAGDGRVLIRPSGTEPVIRVMIEGSDLEKITERATFLVNLIEEKSKTTDCV